MRQGAVGIHLAGAALFAGAAAWGLQQQAGYVAVSWICGDEASRPVWLITALALVLLLAGSWISWMVLGRSRGGGLEGSDVWRPRRFLGLVALMAALLFLFAILLQAGAALVLPGCLG